MHRIIRQISIGARRNLMISILYIVLMLEHMVQQCVCNTPKYYQYMFSTISEKCVYGSRLKLQSVVFLATKVFSTWSSTISMVIEDHYLDPKLYYGELCLG